MLTVITDKALEAAAFIKANGIVAFPTETVYGLGANLFDARAVAKIFDAKRRPPDNPLIAHIGGIEQIGEIAQEIGKNAQRLIDAFFPGPLTVVLSKTDRVPSIATAGLDTIGVRMPRLPLTNKFLKACGTPVAAPSANLSGRPSPTTWEAVFEDLDGRIDCILQGELTEIGIESTVVDCTTETPVILRHGAVSLAELREVVADTRLHKTGDEAEAKSPGLKHRHYSPKGNVILVDSIITNAKRNDSAYIGLDKKTVAAHFDLAIICNSVEDYAQSLFEFLRECDRRGIGKIYCETVPETGIGAALTDRLTRAAQK